MANLFYENIKVIERRWPKLAPILRGQDVSALQAFLVSGQEQTLGINGVQLTSRYARKAEAGLQASEIPSGSVSATLFGTGLGDVQRELLSRDELKLLQVVILNEAVFHLVLQYSEQQDWLSDPRVNLVLGSQVKAVTKPYFVLRAEVTLASDSNTEIKNELMAESTRVAANRGHRGEDPAIIARLEENIPFIESDPDVAELFNSEKGRMAFVIGAGPSLETHYDHIREQLKSDEPPLIISVDTALPALLSNSIVPDITVSLDPKITEHHLGRNRPDSIKLVYLPRIPHKTIKAWQGQRYVAYSAGGAYDRVMKEYPKTCLFSYGSVIHPAIDLAVKMGVRSVTLFGADFAYANNKTHAHWGDGRLGAGFDKAQYTVVNNQGGKTVTNRIFITYLRGVEKYIETTKTRFFNASLQGAKIAGTSLYKGGNP